MFQAAPFFLSIISCLQITQKVKFVLIQELCYYINGVEVQTQEKNINLKILRRLRGIRLDTCRLARERQRNIKDA